MLHDLFFDVWHDLFLILHCNELDDMLLKLVPNILQIVSGNKSLSSTQIADKLSKVGL